MRNWLATFKPLRQVVAVAIIAVGMAGISATAKADDMLRVGKSVPEPFSFTPLDIGMQKGIFKKTRPRHPGDRVRRRRQTAAGHGRRQYRRGLGSGPAMAFIAKGSPVKAIAAMAGPPLLLAIVVRPDGPKTVADLKGKKVSVSTAGSLTYFLVSETSRSQGWGRNGIDIEPMGAMPGQIAALKRGDIDGIIMDVGNAFDLEKKGEGRILVRFTQMKDFMIHVIYATDKDIASKPDDLRNFLKGWFETIAFMRANKAETVKIAGPITGKDEDITSRSYDEIMPMFSDNGKFSQAALEGLSRSWIELGMLKEPPDLKTLYTEQFLPK